MRKMNSKEFKSRGFINTKEKWQTYLKGNMTNLSNIPTKSRVK